MTPAEQVAEQLAVCGDEGVVPATPAEVLAAVECRPGVLYDRYGVRWASRNGRNYATADEPDNPLTFGELVDEYGPVTATAGLPQSATTQLAQVVLETGKVLAERGEEIAALTVQRDRYARDADDLREYALGAMVERDRMRRGVVQLVDDYDLVKADDLRELLDGDEESSDVVLAADQVLAVRDLATEWILTGEVAAVAYGRAVIAKLDGGESS